MDFNESEKEDSLVDDNGSEYEDEDDELCDVKSNKSREDNEMNEVFHVAQSTNSQLQLWRIASLLILIGTFVAILTSTILIINGEHDDDDEEAFAVTFAKVQTESKQKLIEHNQVMSLLAQSITASNTEPSKFPFVRVSHFELLGRHAREALGGSSILWAPFVAASQLPEWSSFCYQEQDWYNESLTIFQSDPSVVEGYHDQKTSGEFREYIWEGDDLQNVTSSNGSGPFAPLWHISPPSSSSLPINYNVLHEAYIKDALPTFVQSRESVLSSAQNPDADHLWSWAAPSSHVDFAEDEKRNGPFTTHLTPVFERLYDVNSTLVGVLLSKLVWVDFISSLFHGDDHGIVAILHNSCNQSYTYTINDGKAVFLGEGNLLGHSSDDANDSIRLETSLSNEVSQDFGLCLYSLHILKTNEYWDETKDSNVFYLLIAFAILAVTFISYDRFVNKKNKKILQAAKESHAIISSLFPAQVRARLFLNQDDRNAGLECSPTTTDSDQTLTDLRNGIGGSNSDYMYNTKPIADLFPDATILFADIVGFTAWSSVREPTQVFILLETLFRAFDEIAKKRRVFKVETVGDCYVAVTGLPKPRKDHAVAMARFAHDCMVRMQVLVKKLEVTLGPDTGDLSMRMGLHSGPVTAGVLRGERSRFQLFGDTMNTAARMEHNGQRDKIQITQDTADLLIAAGKTTWITQREDVVVAKGKGEMQTYWLQIGRANGTSSSDHTSTSNGSERGDDQNMETLKDVENSPNVLANEKGSVLDSKTRRLVDWNVDVLLRLIRQIVAHRRSCPILPEQKTNPQEERFACNITTCPLDEVKEIITLPGFRDANSLEDPDDIVLPKVVVDQMREYVSRIALNYRKNSFHSFEHASHVTMSVVKLLSRIVAPKQDESGMYHEITGIASTLHDHTYGITSDPLTQFSCVLSALIHDVDHPGVSNTQLIKEGSAISQRYNGKSPSEQHAVDFSWNLLMEEQFMELRATIYQTDAELVRFRQLIVNSVMATDKADKELKRLRDSRWDRAFSSSIVDLDPRDTINRKATIVIEHLIQASDEAHTMQHWHIYRKWNERFFFECYQAYLDGRAEKNPADKWFEREVEFFDFYIIPLVKKLKDCGVFGVSSDEYLNYALRNRQEWVARGRELVSDMLDAIQSNEISRLSDK